MHPTSAATHLHTPELRNHCHSRMRQLQHISKACGTKKSTRIKEHWMLLLVTSNVFLEIHPLVEEIACTVEERRQNVTVAFHDVLTSTLWFHDGE